MHRNATQTDWGEDEHGMQELYDKVDHVMQAGRDQNVFVGGGGGQ